jgi:hypothetical protein
MTGPTRHNCSRLYHTYISDHWEATTLGPVPRSDANTRQSPLSMYMDGKGPRTSMQDLKSCGSGVAATMRNSQTTVERPQPDIKYKVTDGNHDRRHARPQCPAPPELSRPAQDHPRALRRYAMADARAIVASLSTKSPVSRLHIDANAPAAGVLKVSEQETTWHVGKPCD